MEEDDKYGKLPKMQEIILQGKDKEIDSIEAESYVVFSLSSSYIAFPSQTLNSFISKFISKSNTCKTTTYL